MSNQIILNNEVINIGYGSSTQDCIHHEEFK